MWANICTTYTITITNYPKTQFQMATFELSLSSCLLLLANDVHNNATKKKATKSFNCCKSCILSRRATAYIDSLTVKNCIENYRIRLDPSDYKRYHIITFSAMNSKKEKKSVGSGLISKWKAPAPSCCVWVKPGLALPRNLSYLYFQNMSQDF